MHHLPFDRPFDKLTVPSNIEGLMALSKGEGLRYRSVEFTPEFSISYLQCCSYASIVAPPAKVSGIFDSRSCV